MERSGSSPKRSREEPDGAELKSLRNQLNPHFLLNTLNNIYALIAFDTDKAQQAVQELSRCYAMSCMTIRKNTFRFARKWDSFAITLTDAHTSDRRRRYRNSF